MYLLSNVIDIDISFIL